MTEGGASDASILFIMLTDHRWHCCMSADYFFFCDIDVEFQTAYADIQNLHITELSGREEKDIRSNYDALIDYNSLFNHQPLKFPTCAMSESGRIHFEEVKKIFDFFGWLFVGTLLLTAACVALASYCRNTLYCSAGFSWSHGCCQLGLCLCYFSSACI